MEILHAAYLARVRATERRADSEPVLATAEDAESPGDPGLSMVAPTGVDPVTFRFSVGNRVVTDRPSRRSSA
jgi:hypothetical protein